jgi:hypothetical protein
MAISFFDLSVIDGTNGIVISGIDADLQLGNSLSSAGDVNGDGFIDLIIGAKNGDTNGENNAGKAYVIFGSDRSFAGFQLSNLNGSNGFVINGIDPEDLAGTSVSSLKFNGDRYSDLVIGASNADPNNKNNAGESYVVYGKNSGFAASLNLGNLNGTNGSIIRGIDAGDLAGFAVSKAGDINNDNIDDLIISAQLADPNGRNNAGESYIVFGKSSGFPANLELSTLNGTNGFVINGIDGNDLSGVSVDGVGDVNGDDIDDLIIGARNADPNSQDNAGESYVVFGKSSGFAASLNLANLNGTNGFIIKGVDAGDTSGFSVSGAGDINGDGLNDLIIGAPAADRDGRDNVGAAYVIFGQNGGFAGQIDLSTLNGRNGFAIYGMEVDDLLGTAVSGGMDVNGDRLDDLFISAVGSNNDKGTTYVVFGDRIGFPAVLDLEDLHPNQGYGIRGTQANGRAGTAVSDAGDVNGDGIDDLAIGAPLVDVGGLSNTGEAYVVFGSDERSLDLDDYVRAAGDTTEGIAIAINNVEDLSQIEFTFTFDPNLLDVTGFTAAGDFTAWDSTFTTIAAGEVRVTLTGDALTGGAAEVGMLNVEVPEDAVYGSITPIALESVEFNNGSLNGMGDTATQILAHRGDANKDGRLTFSDAAIISSLAAGLEDELAAYPGVNPLLVADLNDDGIISAFDAYSVI